MLTFHHPLDSSGPYFLGNCFQSTELQLHFCPVSVKAHNLFVLNEIIISCFECKEGEMSSEQNCPRQVSAQLPFLDLKDTEKLQGSDYF